MTDPQAIAAGLSEAELRAKLQSMVGVIDHERVTAKTLASQWKIPASTLCYILAGRHGISEKVANALGYDRVVTFVPREPMKEQADD